MKFHGSAHRQKNRTWFKFSLSPFQARLPGHLGILFRPSWEALLYSLVTRTGFLAVTERPKSCSKSTSVRIPGPVRTGRSQEHAFFNIHSIVHHELVTQGQIVNAQFYCNISRHVRETFVFLKVMLKGCHFDMLEESSTYCM